LKIATHRALGPGVAGIHGCGSVPKVYEAVLESDLQKRGLSLAQQQAIPAVYEGTRFEMGFRADLAEIAAVHKKQLLTYLRLSDKHLGPLIDFNVAPIKGGATRVVKGLED
jgi:GxxExxY protein